MNTLSAILYELNDGMRALDEQRAKPGSDQDAALCEAEARVLTLAAKQLEDLLDADPGNVFVKQAFDSVMRPCFNAVTRFALFKRRDADRSANGFLLAKAVSGAFDEMNAYQQAAEAGDRAAIIALRDLSLRAELIAERGAALYPGSRYRFERLRKLAREGGELWQSELDEATLQ